MGFVEDYFLAPMADKTGYNIVNTLTYAAIAVGALYLIYRYMEKKKVSLGTPFWKMLVAFIVFGSSIRVVTDSIDSGAMGKFAGANPSHMLAWAYNAVLASHALDYGVWTITPGIYIVTAALFLTTWMLCRAYGKEGLGWKIGALFALMPLALLLPMSVHLGYAAAIIVMAGGAALIVKTLLKFEWKQTLPVFAHAFDGAATWVAINWVPKETGVQYFEQHVLSSGIGGATPLGFGLFFALKVCLAGAAVYYLTRKDGKEEVPPLALELTLAAITVLGLAPGLRDLLRLLAGT